MKRYFDLHDKKETTMLTFSDSSPDCCAPAETFQEHLASKNIKEITLSQYRRLSVQYGEEKKK